MNSGWQTKSINDCCDILDNRRVPLNEEARSNMVGTVPYYGANGVQGYIDKYIFDEDLILIAEDGGYFDEYAIRPIAYKISGRSWVNNHAHVLKAKADYNQDYLFYSLVHKNILKFILGGTRAKLNQSELKAIELSFPPLKSEQSAIARILSTVDEAIENSEQLIAKYERIKTGLMQDLLTKGIDEQGRIRSEKTHRFKDSPLGRIPVEWDVVRVDQAGGVKLGRQRSPQHQSGLYTTPYLRVANVFDGWIDYSDVLEMDFTPSERETFNLLEGDILLNEGQSLELVGRSAIFGGPNNTYCFQNTLVRFRSNETTIPAFCRSVFKYWLDRGNFQLVAKQTTSVAHLGADRFAVMPFARPPVPEQLRIASTLVKHNETLSSQSAYLNKLSRLKDGLMHDLLSGKVRVPSAMLSQVERSIAKGNR